MRSRVQALVLLALGLAGVVALQNIVALSQARFFTIDEYQYGHATWLVSRGARPYVDFFEHHFPLSYVLNAPLYFVDWPFATGALLLRKIVLGYLLVAAAFTGLGAWLATRNAATALLSAFLPPSIGFGLMSAIEYRSENFGAFCLILCLLLLEWNQRRDSARLAACCGLLASVAACMTQKMTFIGGVTVATMWAVDVATRARSAPALIARPKVFFGTAIGAGLTLIAIAGALGMLPAGFEATILQAAEHERAYPRFSILERGYMNAFWRMTWPSTVPMLLLAVGYLATSAGRFWAFPIGASLVGGALMVAPYPYNFVFLCFTLALAAVRGLGCSITWVAVRFPAFASAAPLLYLLALPALANQLGYVEGAMTNAHQLETLSKIEKYSSPADAVIDNAGGAMFSRDASYYFHHGAAHRVMFRDYFETQLVKDYRNSRAMFWIRDLRVNNLPQPAQDYLTSHYIRGDGDLYVLGFRTKATGPEPATRKLDVIRAGNYYIHRANAPPPEHPERQTDLLLDGSPLRVNRIFLEEREYTLKVLPHSPRYLITPVASSFFSVGDDDTDEEPEKRPHYSLMFQHHARKKSAKLPDERELETEVD